MRSLFAAGLLLLTVCSAHAQQRAGQLMAYAELLGTSFGGGVAAELALTSRLGISAGTGMTVGFTAGAPLLAHLYSPGGRWELAGGVLALPGEDGLGDDDSPLLPLAYAGFRYVPQRFGVVFRVGGAAALFEDGIFPLPGLSLGLTF
jgi:hypothetical protein